MIYNIHVEYLLKICKLYAYIYHCKLDQMIYDIQVESMPSSKVPKEIISREYNIWYLFHI